MSLKDTILLPTKVLGVEYCFTPDGIRVFTALLQKKKQELILLETKDWTEPEFESYLKEEKNPVKFMISGKGLLSSKNSGKLAENEFCFETRSGQTTMMRKEAFPELVENKSRESTYAGTVLGVPFLQEIAEKLNLGTAHSFCYDLSEDLPRPDWQKETTTVQIGEEKVESTYLGAYLVALSVYLKDKSAILPVSYGGHAFLENLIIKRSVIAFGVFLLALVLVNFFVWDSLVKENDKLSVKNNLGQDQYKEAEQLSEELKLKNTYFTEMGLNRTQYLSFYADRIGVAVPRSVQLNSVLLNPFDVSKLKKEKVYEFASGEVKINGWSKEILPFNQWVSDLKELEWIEKIEVQDYKYNSRKNMSEFHINLDLK